MKVKNKKVKPKMTKALRKCCVSMFRSMSKMGSALDTGTYKELYEEKRRNKK